MTGLFSIAGAAGVAAGALAWTATEYSMHRWVLHGPFGHGRLKHVPLGGIHRAHHRAPMHTSTAARVAGHLAIAATGAGAASAFARLLPVAAARGLGAAWSAGYSTYEITHWNAHHRPARTSYGERLRSRHNTHHYGAPKSNLGVTMSWWDTIFGTEA